MAKWAWTDGHEYEDYEIGVFATEREAREAAIARGGVLIRERTTGAYYRTPALEGLRVTGRGYTSGFVLTGTRRTK